MQMDSGVKEDSYCLFRLVNSLWNGSDVFCHSQYISRWMFANYPKQTAPRSCVRLPSLLNTCRDRLSALQASLQ